MEDLAAAQAQGAAAAGDVIAGESMRFTIAIEPGTSKAAFGVVVPDLPGCFSAGDTIADAFHNAHEAIDAFCETLAEDGW